MCDSTTFALRRTQISLSGILRHFRPPSRPLLQTFVAETRILAEMKIENRGKNFFRGKQIEKHTFFFFKQSVGVAESMEITRERMRVCQQNRALMELSFVDICIFQAISVTEVYGWSQLVKKVC